MAGLPVGFFINVTYGNRKKETKWKIILIP
jgi:hypothetical protein